MFRAAHERMKKGLTEVKPLTWCPKRDLNPHGCNSQGILSPSCLPIPPPRHHSKNEIELQICRCKNTLFFNTNHTCGFFFIFSSIRHKTCKNTELFQCLLRNVRLCNSHWVSELHPNQDRIPSKWTSHPRYVQNRPR